MIYLKQSTSKTLRFGPFLDDSDGKTAETALTISQADIRLSKNGGAFAQSNDGSGATHDENGWYSLQLNATDTNTLGPLSVAIAESGALPVWREFMIVSANIYDSLFNDSDKLQVDVEEVDGDAPAAANLNSACDNYSAERGLSGTALPAAAADAAGGLPISDAGGLNLDTQLANTNEVTAARMSALTDWINGGRLDLILDAILADVTGINGDAMRGTDNAALASVCTEGRLSELDAANLPANIDAILTDTGTTIPGLITALNDISVSDIMTTAMTEAYPTKGATMSIPKALYSIHQYLWEKGISGTTLTTKKRNQTASAKTGTLDDATSPTEITEAT